jgi:hypothetical protein
MPILHSWEVRRRTRLQRPSSSVSRMRIVITRLTSSGVSSLTGASHTRHSSTACKPPWMRGTAVSWPACLPTFRRGVAGCSTGSRRRCTAISRVLPGPGPTRGVTPGASPSRCPGKYREPMWTRPGPGRTFPVIAARRYSSAALAFLASRARLVPRARTAVLARTGVLARSAVLRHSPGRDERVRSRCRCSSRLAEVTAIRSAAPASATCASPICRYRGCTPNCFMTRTAGGSMTSGLTTAPGSTAGWSARPCRYARATGWSSARRRSSWPITRMGPRLLSSRTAGAGTAGGLLGKAAEPARVGKRDDSSTGQARAHRDDWSCADRMDARHPAR